MDGTLFDELLRVFALHPDITDEVTLFTAETHAPLPIEALEERMNVAKLRMSHLRGRGYRAGVNVLATIGHHEENLSNSLAGEYVNLTDIDGNICRGGFCPNDERVREFVSRTYELAALACPDYIWIDDDVRLFGHMPIDAVCFCDNCLDIFEQECGTRYTRASLKAAFNEGTVLDKLAVRTAWLQHNRRTITRLFELIESTVHGIIPNLPLGFMTGDRFYEGYDFDNWAKTLAGPDGAEVIWRPGGGFYSDESLKDLIGKSHDIGRQVSKLPESVKVIQSEIENFPYQALKKGAHTTALEAASHIGSGCTGTAFNVLYYDRVKMNEGPLEEYSSMLAGIYKSRPFYDLLAKTLGRSQPVGIGVGWGKNTFAANNIESGSWFEAKIWDTCSHGLEIWEIGIPAAYSLDCSSVTLLSGDGVLTLSDDEIMKILSSGVYMDTQALSRLNEMGYSELTGFNVGDRFVDDCIEEFNEHPINGRHAGCRRDCRQSFKWWLRPATALIPRDSNTQTISSLVNYSHQEVASCVTGIFENKLGGRVCVAGYYPWTFLQSLPKSAQMKRTMSWLSRDDIPCYISSFHRMNLWARKLDGDCLGIVLINSSLDSAQDAKIMLRTQQNEVSVYDTSCRETTLRPSSADGVYREFILPEIGGWEARMLVIR